MESRDGESVFRGCIVFVVGGGGDGAVAFLAVFNCVVATLRHTVCRLLINSVFMRERIFSLCFVTLALPASSSSSSMFVFPHQILRL